MDGHRRFGCIYRSARSRCVSKKHATMARNHALAAEQLFPRLWITIGRSVSERRKRLDINHDVVHLPLLCRRCPPHLSTRLEILPSNTWYYHRRRLLVPHTRLVHVRSQPIDYGDTDLDRERACEAQRLFGLDFYGRCGAVHGDGAGGLSVCANSLVCVSSDGGREYSGVDDGSDCFCGEEGADEDGSVGLEAGLMTKWNDRPSEPWKCLSTGFVLHAWMTGSNFQHFQ